MPRSPRFAAHGMPVDGSIRRNKVILLDTSVLVDALTGPKRSLELLGELLAGRERLAIPALVLYEWLRGPRSSAELADQEELFPPEGAIVFSSEDAAVSARLYRSVRRARSREIDIAIAACAIRQEAELWTLNPADFKDIPGLRLFSPR